MFGFDFSNMEAFQACVAFLCFGFGFGLMLHFIAVTGTAVRWALNSGS